MPVQCGAYNNPNLLNDPWNCQYQTYYDAEPVKVCDSGLAYSGSYIAHLHCNTCCSCELQIGFIASKLSPSPLFHAWKDQFVWSQWSKYEWGGCAVVHSLIVMIEEVYLYVYKPIFFKTDNVCVMISLYLGSNFWHFMGSVPTQRLIIYIGISIIQQRLSILKNIFLHQWEDFS